MNDWFEWNDVKCTDYGMHVMEFPSIVRPKERMEMKTIPGRAGSLTLLEGEDVFDDITLSCVCIVQDPKDIPRICGWLRGDGTVRFANQPNVFYKAVIANQISFDKVLRGNPHRSFSVEFTAKPFAYHHDADTFTVTLRGQRRTNPGNVAAQPLIRVFGTGDVTLMIGDKTIMIDDMDSMDGMIYIDCDAKLAYTGEIGSASDPFILRTSHCTVVRDEWPVIPAGSYAFNWTGNITMLQVTPRWRDIG